MHAPLFYNYFNTMTIALPTKTALLLKVGNLVKQRHLMLYLNESFDIRLGLIVGLSDAQLLVTDLHDYEEYL